MNIRRAALAVLILSVITFAAGLAHYVFATPGINVAEVKADYENSGSSQRQDSASYNSASY